MYYRSYILLFALLSCLFLESMGQSRLLDKSVSVQGRETTVKDYLYAIGKAGGFTFSYGKEVPADRRFTPDGMERSVGGHLELLFGEDSLTWTQKGNKILILPGKSGETPKPKAPSGVLRGRIIDAHSRAPIAGSNLLLNSSGPQKGCTSDGNGWFRFEGVSVGRHELQGSHVGYQPFSVRALVSSGKETILEVAMKEEAFELEEVKVIKRPDMASTLNSLALVSGRSFSAYDVENIPGSLSDISRTAVSFPGVISTNDGQNHIVIRGNSPKGLQWRLEGIEIPNLNHFSEIGASGGGVNVLSNNMLDRSDFLTGAFPAEYGNALSGVFDLRLRTGNNEKHEQTLQLGLIGMEAMVEGPLNRETNSTYIAQYRYSTLKVLSKMGIDLESVPDFQDLSFKIYHPTKKAGVFYLFGIGGLSHETGVSGYEMDSDMFTVGVSNSLSLDPRTHVKSILSYSTRTFRWYDELNMGSAEIPVIRERLTEILDNSARGSLSLNRKLGIRHKLKGGIIYEMAWNDSHMGWRAPGEEHIYIDEDGRAATLQAHLNWSWALTGELTLNTGSHFIQYYLNRNYSLEPRLGLEWIPAQNHVFSAGFGIHSQKESMTLYMGEYTLDDGSTIQPNLDLELSKAMHGVLGYAHAFSPNLHMKTELYYQHLYDVPAYPFPPYFTTMNYDYGYEGNVLLNYGTGYNTGIELSLERRMRKGMSFMWNATVFDSKYRDRPGNWHNTKYNGSYASNGVISKEIKLGRAGQHTLAISGRYILAGGLRYLPINEEASAAAGYTIRIWDNGFEGKWDEYFRVDMLFKLRRNGRRFTSEWSLDFMNILNRQNALSNYWDQNARSVTYSYQNPFLVFINYRIQF